MLEVSQLSRHYGSFVAVDNVSFTIGKGEIVGLLGHNGAGKTTIMKMLSGYLEPHQGRIAINGLDLDKKPKDIQRLLGYLPESLPVYPEMRVADYLDYAAELKGLDDKPEAIRRAVRATDIGNKLLAPIATLSRGYKQRVGVAQAILGNPQLLILDEPTNGLDPTQTDHMRELIRELAKNATVILSTHIMQEVDALCNRVLIIRDGKLAVDEKLAALREDNCLKVSTSLTPDNFNALVQPISAINSIKELTTASTDIEGIHQFRITLNAGATQQTGSAIASAIIKAGGELYLLQPERRDLETLFREVNTAGSAHRAEEGYSHAA